MKDANPKYSIVCLSLALVLWLLLSPAESGEFKASPSGVRVPILLYHRFGPVVADSMTVTTAVFESHLNYLKENGYTVIPLRHLVNYHLGRGTLLHRPGQWSLSLMTAIRLFIQRCCRL